jgi:hypothetical protein
MLLGSNNYRYRIKRGRCEVERLHAHTHTHTRQKTKPNNNWNFYETPIIEDIRTRIAITSLDFFTHMHWSNLNIFRTFLQSLVLYVTKKILFCKILQE